MVPLGPEMGIRKWTRRVDTRIDIGTAGEHDDVGVVDILYDLESPRLVVLHKITRRLIREVSLDEYVIDTICFQVSSTSSIS